MPTLDNVLLKLNKARIFSKLDVQEAYYHIRLDKESSRLTTMITPFGLYRWMKLPFGIKVASKIFQKRLQDALGDLDGMFMIADDIVIAGCGETDEIAKQDNDGK